MKYTKFLINNYKGIEEVEIKLDNKPSQNIFTLVGLNESGKTSILEAINLFQKEITKEDAHQLIPRHSQHIYTGSVNIEATLEFEDKDVNIINFFLKGHKFKLDKDEKEITIIVKYDFENSIPKENNFREKLYITDLTGKLKKAKKSKRLYEADKSIWNNLIILIEAWIPEIIYYPDFLFKFPEKIYLEMKSGDISETDKEYKNILQDVLDSFTAKLDIDDHILQRIKNLDEIANKASLDQLGLKMSEKLNEEILKRWNTIFGNGQDKRVEINYGDDNKGYFICFRIIQGSDGYSINERSLGFRWFFSFLIFTAFRTSRKTDQGETLFLLDEPASNLHQKSQQKLLETLHGIVADCKLIYSTHSHHLINPLWLSGTYIIKNEGMNYKNPEDSKITQSNIKSTIYKQFVSKYPNEEDHFKPILDALEYQPSKLEFVPNLIFTEGKFDYYTFKYISKLILSNEESNNLHFYPGAGVSKYESIFRLYTSWGKNFIAIFDDDVPGKREKEKYIKSIEQTLEKNIFTLGDISQKFKSYQTENLFSSENEKLKIIQYSFPEHKKEDGFIKSKFNTSIQDLYINSIHFNLNEKTIKNFKEVFNFIKNKFKAFE
ncbi:MAG: ATP-binding protein [Bacteroidota bacterium]|nr:ATP-binding protein [Bacteroidota bacterium]